MPSIPMPSREERFRDFIEAARGTRFYSAWFGADRTVTPETLGVLPRVTLRQLEDHPDEFYSRRSRREKPRIFRYPLEKEPKIAMIMDGFRSTARVRNFSDFHPDELADLNMDTVAAPLPLMRQLALRGHAQRFPIVVFTGPGHGYLTDADRDLFWRVFEVPLFEQFTGLGGEVLAEECEAHEGLHIRPGDALFEIYRGELLITSLTRLEEPVFRLSTGCYGRLDESPCACGRTSARLIQSVQKQTVEKALAMSA